MSNLNHRTSNQLKQRNQTPERRDLPFGINPTCATFSRNEWKKGKARQPARRKTRKRNRIKNRDREWERERESMKKKDEEARQATKGKTGGWSWSNDVAFLRREARRGVNPLVGGRGWYRGMGVGATHAKIAPFFREAAFFPGVSGARYLAVRAVFSSH